MIEAGAAADHPALPQEIVLVDSSAWLRHLRARDPLLEALLLRSVVRGHADIAGEIAMGRDPEASEFRDEVLALPSLAPVDRMHLLQLVSSHAMNGTGIGWIDAGLIGACLESAVPVWLYTFDRRMARVAVTLGIRVLGPGP